MSEHVPTSPQHGCFEDEDRQAAGPQLPRSFPGEQETRSRLAAPVPNEAPPAIVEEPRCFPARVEEDALPLSSLEEILGRLEPPFPARD